MHVAVNLRHLEEGTIQLAGEISPEEVELAELKDALVQVKEPLHYDIEVEKQNENLYVHGRLWQTLDCRCKRCLKEFKRDVELNPYHGYIPLEGEDAAPVANDMVDLTPYFREDMLLAYPQHPLCSEDCKGIATASGSIPTSSETPSSKKDGKSAWSELDKLKF
jgi:uncharacterized protein